MANREKTGVVLAGGCADCGGKCRYLVHLKDRIPIKLEPAGDLKPCARGYAIIQRALSAHRLKYPLARVGPRGQANSFRRVSWDEALERVASELRQVKTRYGNSAIMALTASGSPGRLHSPALVFRLLNRLGGHTMRWGSYSGEAAYFAGKVTYGSQGTESTRDDLVNSRLIIMWGWNPASTIWGTGTPLHLTRAKEAGARFVAVDPRFHESAAVWADLWVPIRPATDAAMLVAMAYTIIKRRLHDQKFLNEHTVGFERYCSYVLGEEDGCPKTPDWAEKICGVPAAAIEDLAGEYATTKPAALLLGFAPGRTAFGEQTHRAAAILACITGNVGNSGGSAGNSALIGLGASPGPTQPTSPSLMPTEPNPLDPARDILNLNPRIKNKLMVHASSVWDSVLQGKKGGYPADVKFIWVMFADPLNQGANINKGVQALQQIDFMVVNEQFMTPTARYADVVLPVTSHLERDDYERPWLGGDYHAFSPKLMDPPGEARSDMWIVGEVAARLGITDLWEGKSEEEWLDFIISTAPEAKRDLPNPGELKRSGLVYFQIERPFVAFKKQIEDPVNSPFATPSGKIEIYSQRLADIGDQLLPPVPKYVAPGESAADESAAMYPLQLITFHTRSKAHASFEFAPWLKELEPHVVWINTRDAAVRGIRNGEQVTVFNARGKLLIGAYVTERIMPGVVAIGEGAYFEPDENGLDHGGNPNVLVRDQGSPGGAFVTNGIPVQVERP